MDANVLDLSGIFTGAIEIAGTALLAVATRYSPRLIGALDRFLNIQETAQQQTILNGYIQTAVGTIETKLDQKAMQVAHVNIGNATILAEAQNVLAKAPAVAAALGVSASSIAESIVGGVDTLSRTPTPASPPAIIPTAPAAV